MKGKTNVGGGAGLNYKVVGGTTQPSGGGGDTLTWDGNTEGRPVFNIGTGALYYKVSDVVLRSEDFSDNTPASLTMSAGQSINVGASNIVVETEGTFQMLSDENGMFFSLNEPYAGVVDEAGTYFVYFGNQTFASSLTIPGYTGFGGGAPIRENTIWVNTDTEIKYVVFSPVIAGAAEGMVWIKDAASTLSEPFFNALDSRKNYIYCMPQSVKQYVNGAWVHRPSYIYQNGVWRSLIEYFYSYGDEYTSITGGYEYTKIASAGNPAFIKNADNMYLRSEGSWEAGCNFAITSAKKIDVTNIDTLFFNVDLRYDSPTALLAGLSPTRDAFASSMPAYVYLQEPYAGLASVDVSGITGSYHINIGLNGGVAHNYGYCYVYEVYGI